MVITSALYHKTLNILTYKLNITPPNSVYHRVSISLYNLRPKSLNYVFLECLFIKHPPISYGGSNKKKQPNNNLIPL